VIETGIPVKNIFAFFTEEPDDPDCTQVELHEDFINDVVEFHFENGFVLRI